MNYMIRKQRFARDLKKNRDLKSESGRSFYLNEFLEKSVNKMIKCHNGKQKYKNNFYNFQLNYSNKNRWTIQNSVDVFWIQSQNSMLMRVTDNRTTFNSRHPNRLLISNCCCRPFVLIGNGNYLFVVTLFNKSSFF